MAHYSPYISRQASIPITQSSVGWQDFQHSLREAFLLLGRENNKLQSNHFSMRVVKLTEENKMARRSALYNMYSFILEGAKIWAMLDMQRIWGHFLLKYAENT